MNIDAKVERIVNIQKMRIKSDYYRAYNNLVEILLFEKCRPREWALIENNTYYKTYTYSRAMIAAHTAEDLTELENCVDDVLRLVED